MLYVEPTSQYKFVAKPSPTVEETPAVAVDGTATSNTTTTAETVQPQTNTATHFQAAEHVQNKTLNRQSSGNAALGLTYDGKRMRKAVQRRTVDYNSSVIRLLEVVPPAGYIKNPMNAVTTKFVRTSTNKLRCPIFCVVWTPEGRRLVTGASSGEFTLWNGLTFNFETILQAHDRAVRSMVWSHHDAWLLTGDHGGFVKYWQSNMNNVKMYEAHKDPIRGLSFSPSDNKFASCSDDGLVKVWDFFRCAEERQLKGHGADVKCVDWHPSKGLLVSGSKDSQQPVKLWDPKSGNSITTLHAHKSTVMTAKWNDNGNWLLTGSRDHLLKVFDIRVMKELQTFRGHKKEATAVSWHPVHETLFASGGSDGSIMFWLTGVDEKAGAMDKAHEGIVWSLAWHPLGHILCSGSNDHTSKFWTRNRPGDTMHDRYNLDISQQDDGEYNEEGTSSSALPGLAALDTNAIIPGVGLPATASNVVLPDSKDPNDEKHLYGDAGKGRAISLPRTQATTTSSSNAVPRSSLPNASFNRANRHIAAGQQPSGGATTPGIDLPRQIAPGVPRGPEIEANRDLNKSLNPSRGLPPGPRPDLRPARPDPGPPRPGFDRNQTQSGPQFRPPFSQPSNRPQFFGGPRPGVEFRPRVRPGGQDPNFRPSGPFPPNEFMRFPGPSGSHRPGPNFGPPINEQPRDPRPPGFQPPGPDVRAPGQSVSEQEMLGDRKDVRGQSQDQKPVGPRDMFGRSNESPRASPPVLPSTHGRPERRDSDPTAHGMRGDYHARELEQQRHRNRDQIPGDNQKLPDQGPSRHGPPDQGRRGQGLPDQGHPGQGPDGPGQPLFARQNPNPRGGPSFEPPFDKAFPDHAHGRPDIGRPDQPPHERPNIGRPGERQFHNQPDMRRHGDWGPHAGPPRERPDMGRPGDRPHHDRRDIGRPGDRPPQDIGRPGDRPLQDMGRPGGRPPQDMGRPGGRPPQDMGRPGGRPPQDMGRIGDRPPQDMGRPGDRPPQDIGRPVDRPPQDMGRPGGRPPQDMGRPGDRPPQDMGRPGDRPPQDMGRPGDRPPQDMGRPGGRPQQDMGRPGDRPPQDMGRPGDRPPQDMGRPGGRPPQDMGRPGDRPPQDMGRPGDRPPQDMGRPGDRPPHGMGRPGDRSPYERSTIGGPGGPSLHERPGIPDLGHSRDRPPHSRPDMGRPGDHPHDRPNMGHPVDQQDRLGVGRPGERPSHDTSDLGRPEQRLPHDRPDVNRPGDRPSFNRPDMARHGEPPPNNRPDLVRPGDRPRFNRPDLVRSGERPPHDRPEMGQPGNRPPFDRPERGHPGDRPPFNRPDMGRPGERPPHDRPDMGRPTDRPPHDRPDMGRPADRPPFDRPDMRRPGNRSPHNRPDMGRPGDRPSHDRPDMVRPGNRSPHDRPDVGRPGDRSPRDRPDMGRPGDSREAPREPLLHERPGLLGTPPRGDKGRPDPTFHNRPDMGHDRAGGPPPRPGMGPPGDKPNDVFKFPRDPQNFAASINERPRQDSASKPNFGGRDRASPGRLEANHDTANQSERRDGMGKPGEQGTIKPLMSLMAARPGGGHHPPGGLGNQPGHTGIETEKRGRKRSTEHEYDRAPKRKETGENRDRAW